MDAWLRAWPAGAWATLPAAAMTTWLWFDTNPGEAVHIEPELPSERPADVTHLWGWTSDRLGRWRIDHALPGGTVGAVLSLADPEESGWDRTTVQVHEGSTWDPADGLTSLDPNHPVLRGRRPVTSYTVRVPQNHTNGALAIVPLSFLRITT